MEMAAILPALTSLSFKDKSDEAYDREIRDFITYIKQLLTNKNSSIISDSDRILDVSQVLIFRGLVLKFYHSVPSGKLFGLNQVDSCIHVGS